MRDVDWMTYARSLIGVREIPGAKHSPTIMDWIRKLGPKKLGVAVKDDETPWCGTFAAHVMDHVGITPPPIAVRASAWSTWGRGLLNPRPGCVLTFTREGGGHVGFYAGEDDTHLHVLGGNQGNAVSITRISKNRLSAMRWPHGVFLPSPKIVRLAPNGTPVTVNER
ncbi:MAG: TIGR02594 family protein [Brevundimonas sp.]|uniref:TIGR02594 family protein n=1 Tax=Brevundimonas sp. TaxID=1871086 RepID=UPI00403397E0